MNLNSPQRIIRINALALGLASILLTSCATNDPCQCTKAYDECVKIITDQYLHNESQCEYNHDQRVKHCKDEDDPKACKEALKIEFEKCDDNAADARDRGIAGCQDNQNGCDKECKEESESNSSGSRTTEDCPPNALTTPLGDCKKTLKVMSDLPPGEGGCAPGMVRGHDDRCVPRLMTIRMKKVSEGYLVVCPPGTRPSPNDGGCILDFESLEDPPSDAPGAKWPNCPSGTAPGPKGGCVPIVQLGQEGNGFLMEKALRVWKEKGHNGALEPAELTNLNAMIVKEGKLDEVLDNTRQALHANDAAVD